MSQQVGNITGGGVAQHSGWRDSHCAQLGVPRFGWAITVCVGRGPLCLGLGGSLALDSITHGTGPALAQAALALLHALQLLLVPLPAPRHHLQALQ